MMRVSLPVILLLSNSPFPKSDKDAASVVAYDLVKYYTGNNTVDTPGNLPDPYSCTLLDTLCKLYHLDRNRVDSKGYIWYVDRLLVVYR